MFHSCFTILVLMIVMCFFKKLFDKKNDKIKFDIIPKINEEYISVTYGCITFFDSHRFLSSKLGKLVKTLVVNSHKTLKNLKDQYVDKDEILNIVDEKEEQNRAIKNLKEDYPDKIEKSEDASLNYIGENDPKF